MVSHRLSRLYSVEPFRLSGVVVQRAFLFSFFRRPTSSSLVTTDRVEAKTYTPRVKPLISLTEEDVNDMRKRSVVLLSDPITAISIQESRQKQVSIPQHDRTPLKNIYWKLIGSQRHASLVARRLLALALERVDLQPLRTAFHINDGFNHRFHLLILHIWIIHQRLTLEGVRGEFIDDHLFRFLMNCVHDWLWIKDTPEYRFAAEAHHCQSHIFSFCHALDNALEYIDILPAHIHQVLWHRLYEGEINPDEEYLDLLTKYVIRQWTHVLQLESKHVVEGYFTWADFPGIPRCRVTPPFTHNFQQFGYHPKVWLNLQKDLGIVHKRSEMYCLRDYNSR